MTSKLNYSLNDLRKIVEKHLLLEDYNVVDVLVAAVIANKVMKTDPLWLLIIGPSSSAKTELLNAVEDVSGITFISDLTPQTLISGKKDASLLPKLNNKIMVMKDFTTILSKRPDDLKAIMAQLREVADGKMSKAFGTGDMPAWKGHVGFIGCCTPVYDRHYSVIGQMGERFILYRHKNHNGYDTGKMALQSFGREPVMRIELKRSFKKFFSQFKGCKIAIAEPSKEVVDVIVFLAGLCGMARTAVHRDTYTQEYTYLPEPEGTPRLTKQLYHLGLALMVARGGTQITDEILSVVQKVAYDLIPRFRAILIKYLWDEKALGYNATWKTTSEIAEDIDINKKTINRTMDDLKLIGMVRVRWQGEGHPYEYQLKSDVGNLIEGSEIF